MGASQKIYDYLSDHPEFRAIVGLYHPDNDAIEDIKTKIEDVEIKVFCGDWCPDCRVQLPRFLSVILALKEEGIDIEIIEVNRAKVDSFGKAEEFNVRAIPSFIFLRDGEEIGRIIERPKENMEEDIIKIVK